MVVELRGKKQLMRLDEISRLHIFYSPRSTFDLVRSGQRSNVREKWHFLALHAHSGVSMCCRDLNLHQRVPRPILNKIVCLFLGVLGRVNNEVILRPWLTELDRVMLLCPVATFIIRSAPKYSSIALAGCDRRNGQNSNWSNDDDWPRGWERSGLETFLGTMNHKFRFSTSGNPTKHMPIDYWSLWGQQRSVTLGDLSWPWNSHDARSRVTTSHILTPIISTIPIQVNRTTPSCVYSRFRWYAAEDCSSYDVMTSWPDLTWPIFFSPKVAQKTRYKLWKISARYSKRCSVQLRKTHGGCINPLLYHLFLSLSHLCCQMRQRQIVLSHAHL